MEVASIKPADKIMNKMTNRLLFVILAIRNDKRRKWGRHSIIEKQCKMKMTILRKQNK